MSRYSVTLPLFDFQTATKDRPQSAMKPELSLGRKNATWRRSGEFVHSTISKAKGIGVNALATSHSPPKSSPEGIGDLSVRAGGSDGDEPPGRLHSSPGQSNFLSRTTSRAAESLRKNFAKSSSNRHSTALLQSSGTTPSSSYSSADGKSPIYKRMSFNSIRALTGGHQRDRSRLSSPLTSNDDWTAYHPHPLRSNPVTPFSRSDYISTVKKRTPLPSVHFEPESTSFLHSLQDAMGEEALQVLTPTPTATADPVRRSSKSAVPMELPQTTPVRRIRRASAVVDIRDAYGKQYTPSRITTDHWRTSQTRLPHLGSTLESFECPSSEDGSQMGKNGQIKQEPWLEDVSRMLNARLDSPDLTVHRPQSDETRMGFTATRSTSSRLAVHRPQSEGNVMGFTATRSSSSDLAVRKPQPVENCSNVTTKGLRSSAPVFRQHEMQRASTGDKSQPTSCEQFQQKILNEVAPNVPTMRSNSSDLAVRGDSAPTGDKGKIADSKRAERNICVDSLSSVPATHSDPSALAARRWQSATPCSESSSNHSSQSKRDEERTQLGKEIREDWLDAFFIQLQNRSKGFKFMGMQDDHRAAMTRAGIEEILSKVDDGPQVIESYREEHFIPSDSFAQRLSPERYIWGESLAEYRRLRRKKMSAAYKKAITNFLYTAPKVTDPGTVYVPGRKERWEFEEAPFHSRAASSTETFANYLAAAPAFQNPNATGTEHKTFKMRPKSMPASLQLSYKAEKPLPPLPVDRRSPFNPLPQLRGGGNEISEWAANVEAATANAPPFTPLLRQGSFLRGSCFDESTSTMPGASEENELD